VNTRLRADTLIRLALIAGLPALACAPASPEQRTPPRNDAGLPMADGAAPSPDAVSLAASNMVGCRHLKTGPFSPATGKVLFSYSDPGPPIDNGAKAYRLTLPKAGGHFGFKVPSEGEWVIFASRTVPIQVFTWDGTRIEYKEATAMVPECTEVKVRENYMLATDTKPHVIRFGGDSEAPVDVVISSVRP
jgi:hypothetical protein